MATRQPSDYLPDLVTGDMHSQRKRLGNSVLSRVWKWDAQTVVKQIVADTTSEVAAMRLVLEITSIPVPRVFQSFVQAGTNAAIIFMEYIDGEPLDQVWETYTTTQRENIIAQLKGYIDELRQIIHKFIGSVNGSGCNDQNFDNMPNYGPYTSEDGIREGIVKSLQENCSENAWTDMVISFIKVIPNQNRIVLTHGDLVPRNMLVKDERIVGIIDWEMESFYPEYWEYVKGHLYANFDHHLIRERVLDKLLTPFPLTM
jgi:aminoglycoside phosphotransferase (APT) family kinase protein